MTLAPNRDAVRLLAIVFATDYVIASVLEPCALVPRTLEGNAVCAAQIA
jgi:hypothetical protein